MQSPIPTLLLTLFVALLSACSTLHVKVVQVKASDPLRSTERPATGGSAIPAFASGDTAVLEAVDLAQKNAFRNTPGLRIESKGADLLDPSRFNAVIPASSIRIKGLHSRSARPGYGVPFVLWAKKGAKVLEDQPGVPNAGMAVPATVVLTQTSGGGTTLRFYDTLKTDHIIRNGKKIALANDFSASLAYAISKGSNRTLDVRALFHTGQNLVNAGLYQLEPYDPHKIPVVFVHGLLCRPEAWTQAANQLLADPKIRKHYQFWYFRYPTGLPIWASAAILREELNRFGDKLDPSHDNPNLDRKILVGHSMGGLISDLMTRKGGNDLWGQFSDTPMERLPVGWRIRKMMARLMSFEPRKDVSRVIYVSTPHRGSPLAMRQLAGFLASFIKLPDLPLNSDKTAIRTALHHDMRSLFTSPANGISCLRAKSPILLSILKLPREDVPYHSIIGDQGKHNTPNSTDGIVPYWSSHMEGAVSEKVVSSGHGANENSDGIEEIRRILVSSATAQTATPEVGAGAPGKPAPPSGQADSGR